ncbi:hypothetical protein M758_6G149400 [Ceratodon purpureus]|uniref:Lectin n=1 Tax=Ceratodon purpureus TaxID=3225 RepID=A0A8T0HFC4_CERPU|nr:hypothetical protein KC19_6G154500 [Ceratodon purpureus]KAG0614072.1 hypothetical protein M758_6G149400 [Ceratodon purpureus]
MQSYAIHVRVIQTEPSSWFDIVEKTVYHNARGGTWTDCVDESLGDQTLTMGGSGTSGMLRFKNPKGEQFLVALGVHNYKRWCDIIPDVPLDKTAVDIHPTYYPTVIETGKRGKIVQRVLEDKVMMMFFRILEDRVTEQAEKPPAHQVHNGPIGTLFHFISTTMSKLRFMGFSMVFVMFFLGYLAFLLFWVFVLGNTDSNSKSADSFKPKVFGDGIGNRGEMLWQQLPKMTKTTPKGTKVAVNYYKQDGNTLYVTIAIGDKAAQVPEITAT